ncbi:hypothetical protein BZG36_04397 [Bifiguratus adelaidae]|uniref:Uncharacterized protein n=1 Tax=Bifiguratus adelaidae TaxID=1938954 RepID=A0A261XVR4_9FUNG|nr:hypothetical protein BZG36_04397 [Bifiguratus adelaidae]
MHNDPVILNQSKFRADGLTIPFTFNDVSETKSYYTDKGSGDIYDKVPTILGSIVPIRRVGLPLSIPVIVLISNLSTSLNLTITQSFKVDHSMHGEEVDIPTAHNRPTSNLPRSTTKPNYAQGITMQSLYMTYGGTSLSALAAPFVCTSAQITLTSYGTSTTDLMVDMVNSPSYIPRPGYNYTVDTT